MSNSYLCDACERQRDTIENEICAYRLKHAGKIVRSDGDMRKPEELCAHWKERA